MQRGDAVDNEQADERELTDAEVALIDSPITDIFGRCICDEAHSLKSPRSLTSIAVRQLHAQSYTQLTSTSIMNRVSDLASLLHLL